MRRLPAGVLLLAALAASGAAPPPPPRGLTAEEQKAVDALQAQLDRHAVVGQFEQAARLAGQIATFRAHHQGARHWQASNARFEAADWQRLVRVPQSDRPAVVRARALNGEGVALFGKRRYREAEKALREALAIRLEVLGERHPDTATICNSVAVCLDSQGKHKEALPLYRRALAIRLEVLGEHHPDTAASCGSVAYCLSRQGKHKEALPLVRRALDISLTTYGERHPDTANACGGVASCLNSLGEYGEALLFYRRALAIYLELYGERHPQTAGSYNSVAYCLDSQRKHGEALPLHRRALAIRLVVFGEKHPSTAQSYNNVAHCLDAQGKHGEALPLLRRALAICLEVHGDHHPVTATTCNNVALCLGRQGRPGEALPLYQRALAIFLGVHGELHPHTARSYTNVARCLDEQGKHGDALPLYQQALGIFLKVRGEQNADTATCYHNLGACLHRQGKHGDALPPYRRALAVFRKVHGEQHPDTAASCSGIASCLDGQGKYGEALPLHQQVLGIFLKFHGEQHPLTAISYNNVAHCLNNLGKHVEALPLYRRALAICLQVHGKQHPDTARACNNLASCLHLLGRQSEALRLIQASLPDQEVARFHVAATGFDRAVASARMVSPQAMLAAGLARLGQPRNGFRHAELALARGLLDDLAGTDPGERDRVTRLSAELHSLDIRLTPLLGLSGSSGKQTTERDQLFHRRRTLQAELARLASAVSARQVLPLERIQRQIPADAALVLWIDDLGEHLGCVLRCQGPPRWVPLPGSGNAGAWTEEDARLPERCHAALADPTTGAVLRDLLYRQRLLPLEKHLAGVRRLLVVPTGALARVPVEALTDRWTVSYVPSGSAFARAAEQPRRPRMTSALVLADPVFTATPPRYPPAPPHGLLVKAVVSGSLAARVGLRPGDVLLEHAGKALKSPGDLEPGDGAERVAIRLWRDGKALAGRIPAGKLGVVVDQRPLGEALAAWRAEERKLLASTRARSWAALPGTRREAQALAGLLPSARLLLGSAASEQALEDLASSGKLKGLSLLHLATHGEANPTRPLDTALILAQDHLPEPKEQEARVLGGKKPLQGRLTVDTILRTWQLDADLVTLSACQSGLGADAKGEGMLGFAQTLLQKGARSVVLSRWKVDDAATALLMVRFYENLLGKRAGLKQPLSGAAALAEAKQWLRTLPRRDAERLVARLAGGLLRGTIDEALPVVKGRPVKLPEGERPFAHPYYWAAFVRIGDPR
jgi:tetratricopeptide (TPR) repeat protein